MGEHHDILHNIYPEGCTGSVKSMYVYIYNAMQYYIFKCWIQNIL